jgi:prephenate dehydrogenase
LTEPVLGILGLGVIGGSIGLRARCNGVHVVGADSDPVALDTARNVGAIDAVVPPEMLSRLADVVVIAAHLEPTLREIARLANEPAGGPALLLDVASVKVPVAGAGKALSNFVATHPMAGSERSGPSAARRDLFEGCSWAYVPTGDRELDGRARRFIESLGGIPVAMTAEEHDRVVAITSHLPQVVASCYARMLRTAGDNAERLCGPVARELLRISGMSSTMWGDILQANAHNVEPELRRLSRELEAAADALAQNGRADGG